MYANLAITAGFASLAVLLYARGLIGESPLLAAVLMVGGLLGSLFLPPTPRNGLVRHGALYSMGFGQGWMTAPFVNSILAWEPNTLLMALVATVLIFGSFTMSAFYSPRRQYLYLGGMLGMVASLLAVAGISNIFFRSSTLMSFELYLGLALFSFYVLYDTQVIIERAEAGSRDPVLHSVTLFTDLAAIFIRLLVILARSNAASSNSDRDRDRRSKRR